MKRRLLFLALIATARADFALQDGDTVAFLGDSITAARGYTKVVEHYTLMRFPDRKVRFVNAGEGGDTASKCLDRLQRDVFDQGATVVTVAFGINDIGWGTKADDEHKQAYLDGIRTIIGRCREKKVRPFICSPAVTEGNPDKAEKEYLQTMADEGMALAKSLGVETIDLQRGMREIQRKVIESNKTTKEEDRTYLHVKDGIHLTDFGQLAMGYAMLKGLGAPENVSAVTLSAGGVETDGCTVNEVEWSADGVAFTRLDEGLPLNFGPFTALQYRWIPVPDGINRYLLTVRDLPEGEYEIVAGGRSLGKASASELARGMNISSRTGNAWFPGGPWDLQSCVVKELVDARDKLWMGGQLAKDDPEVVAGVKELDDEMVDLQRLAAKPRPYRFEITRVP
ncbi:SGNH/GDSL hydrolase family protein [Luteolibacter marinus]|uniref:SGNH/GDSL hydrolase family protein n=1 Tax=Luteolibacter marinus TaxID=2776705 RepID=UPI001866E0D0|nr:SGNH/GDSL hydrolase family protein [Luteolibacter marinus]